MAGSRLDRIGTIFSRTTGLIKAGAVQYQDRPLWYDIYRVFPPKYEPFVSREPQKNEVVNILYKEDKFRAMYFKKFGLNPGGIARKLSDRNFEEPSQSFVGICMDLEKSRPEWNEEQVFNAAVESHRLKFGELRSQAPPQAGPDSDVTDEKEALKRHGRRPPSLTVQSLRSLFEEAQEREQKKRETLEQHDLDQNQTDKKP